MWDSRYLMWLLPVAAAAAAIVAIDGMTRAAARRSAVLRFEQRERLDGLGLEEENARLRSTQISDEERVRLIASRAEADSLRKRIAELQRAGREGGENVDRSVIEVRDWAYRGRSNPKATIESVLWAASHGDVDRLAPLLGFAPETRPDADAMFARLPEASKQEYGSPEKVVATLLAGSFPANANSMKLFDEAQVGDQDAAIPITVSHSDGTSRTNVFRFHKAADGWQLLVPATVMQSYASTLQGGQENTESPGP
jgi:hypothetical protein